MPNKKVMHMSVSVDFQPDGTNLSCWMSPDDNRSGERSQFPYIHRYENLDIVWHIHSNIQLTSKLCEAVSNEADRILIAQRAINAKRKAVNR